MSDEDALSRLEVVVEEIAELHGASFDSHNDGGTWLVSLERADDPVVLVRGEGPTKAAALSALISNAQDQGLANK